MPCSSALKGLDTHNNLSFLSLSFSLSLSLFFHTHTHTLASSSPHTHTHTRTHTYTQTLLLPVSLPLSLSLFLLLPPFRFPRPFFNSPPFPSLSLAPFFSLLETQSRLTAALLFPPSPRHLPFSLISRLLFSVRSPHRLHQPSQSGKPVRDDAAPDFHCRTPPPPRPRLSLAGGRRHLARLFRRKRRACRRGPGEHRHQGKSWAAVMCVYVCVCVCVCVCVRERGGRRRGGRKREGFEIHEERGAKGKAADSSAERKEREREKEKERMC